jgi:endoglucanase
MTRLAPRHLLPFAVVAAVAVGCVAPGAHTATAPVLKECGPDGLIDDLNDGNSQVAPVGGRSGYWYVYADKQGTTITPAGTFESVEGGHGSTTGEQYTAEMKGKLATSSNVYAGMGMDFVSPKVTYDVSKYEGITFFAKRAPGTISKLNVKLPDVNTDPDGKICSDCYNDFAYTIDVGEDWQRYVLLFHDLRQDGTWGAPRKPHLDVHKVFAIHWEAKTGGGTFDFFVDDIAFVCGG